MMSCWKPTQRRLYDALDCPCSSLAINCFQVSCCVPHRGLSSYDEALLSMSPGTTRTTNALVDVVVDRSCWMKTVQELAPELTLRDLIIPGSHDSASCTIAKFQPFSAVGRTQQISVVDQLLLGIRHLDLRIAGRPSSQQQATASRGKRSLYIQHGCLQGRLLEQVLQEILVFLESHPSEFILMEMVPEFGQPLEAADRVACLAMIPAILGEHRLLPAADLAAALDQKPLRQLLQEGRQVALLFHPRFVWGMVESDLAPFRHFIVESDQYMRSQWHNTRHRPHLLDWNLEEVKKYGRDRKRILVSQLVMTPGVGSRMDVLGTILGGNSLRPVSLARQLYQAGVLDTFLRDHADERWHVIMLDFCDLCPWLIDFILSLNIPVHLEILAAALVLSNGEQQDVTTKVAGLVRRNRALLFSQVRSDLDIGEAGREGALTLVFRLGAASSLPQVVHLDYDMDSRWVVSHLTSRGAPTLLSTPPSGFIRQGHILPGPDGEIFMEHGTIIKYSYYGGKWQFVVGVPDG